MNTGAFARGRKEKQWNSQMSDARETTVASSRVRVVATGGTFEKIYDPRSESMGFSGRSCIPLIFEACGVSRVALDPLMQMDSLDMDEAIRTGLLAHVRGSVGRRFVIVHGTGTLVETALRFAEARLDCTVVLTGAMIPFSVDPIEASFNLGGAIALAATAPPGTSIYMHGEIFDPFETVKDTAIARFVRHDPAAGGPPL